MNTLLDNDTVSMPSALNPEFEAYRIAIENLASTEDARAFSTISPIHASIVLGNIFRTSKDLIEISAFDLEDEVLNNAYCLEFLKLYLKQQKSLFIFLEKEPPPTSKILQMIKILGCANVNIWKMPEVGKANHPPYFTAADGRMFRLQDSAEENRDICSFNSPTIARQLHEIFKSLVVPANKILLTN